MPHEYWGDKWIRCFKTTETAQYATGLCPAGLSFPIIPCHLLDLFLVLPPRVLMKDGTCKPSSSLCFPGNQGYNFPWVEGHSVIVLFGATVRFSPGLTRQHPASGRRPCGLAHLSARGARHTAGAQRGSGRRRMGPARLYLAPALPLTQSLRAHPSSFARGHDRLEKSRDSSPSVSGLMF